MPKGFTEENTRELIATLKNRLDGKDIVEVVRLDFNGIDDETIREIVENTSTWRDLMAELDGLKNQPKPAKLSESERKKIRAEIKSELETKLNTQYERKYEAEKKKLRKEFEDAYNEEVEKIRQKYEGKQPKTQESDPAPAQPAPKAPEPQPAPAPAPVNKPEIDVWTNPDGTKITVAAVIKNLKGNFVEIPEELLKELKKYEFVPEEIVPQYLACSITPEGEKFIGSYSDYLKSLKEQQK